MCGIFGAFNVRQAAARVGVGLHAQQHRAIDFAGISSSDGRRLYTDYGVGVVRKAFDEKDFKRLHGDHALGHMRYPTVDDDPTRVNIQPITGFYKNAEFAIAHNGNLTNTHEFVHDCKTSLDTEHVAQELQRVASGNPVEDLKHILPRFRGSYALGILFSDRLIAVSDPQQNRPLSIGRAGDSWFIASETLAFTPLEARFVCDVEAGTIISIDRDGMQVTRFAEPNLKRCPFELIYFAHPSSTVYGISVTEFRMRLGEALERHCPAESAEIVVPIPDSANFHAYGFAASGRSGRILPAIVRSHYVGRSFIAAVQSMRDEEVASKFGFTESLIRGKRIALIDDSIVRGTTIPKIIKVLRWLGAAEVHVRIACPVIRHLCEYGIYMHGRDGRLIANEKTIEDIRIFAGADSLQYLPIEVLHEVLGGKSGWCFACMDGAFWH